MPGPLGSLYGTGLLSFAVGKCKQGLIPTCSKAVLKLLAATLALMELHENLRHPRIASMDEARNHHGIQVIPPPDAPVVEGGGGCLALISNNPIMEPWNGITGGGDLGQINQVVVVDHDMAALAQEHGLQIQATANQPLAVRKDVLHQTNPIEEVIPRGSEERFILKVQGLAGVMGNVQCLRTKWTLTPSQWQSTTYVKTSGVANEKRKEKFL